MNTYAIVTAGGTGSRMNNDIPKQFIHVHDKPIILYTLEAFERHPGVDGIVVSCLSGWNSILEAYSKEYGIDKLIGIVEGGETGQESISNAINYLSDYAANDDLVIIHDGNRAFVSQEIISESISTAVKEGNAIACIPCVEVIAKLTNDNSSISEETISRDSLVRTQTPHVFRYGEIVELHSFAKNAGIQAAAAPELLSFAGKEMHLSKGDETNFKVTTQSDLLMFKALLAIMDQ